MCEACETDKTPVEIEMWPISRILAEVKESCDVGDLDEPEEWFAMMANKARDNSFGQLLQAIQKDGFLDPIHIRYETDYLGKSHAYLGNGHHRLTAAILLGLDEIPVTPKRFDMRNSADSSNLYNYDSLDEFRREVSKSLHDDAMAIYAKEQANRQHLVNV